jgi:iron complex outermembrane recepter protein
VDHGGLGSILEGFVNVPLTPVAAIRLVAWDEHDSGYISNVAGTDASAGIVDGVRSFRTYTGATGGTLSNASSVSDHYNTIETKGGRAALNLDIGDNWTVTPTFMARGSPPTGSSATTRPSAISRSCTSDRKRPKTIGSKRH